MEIDYAKYKFNAVVDWVSLELRTRTQTYAWHIQKESQGGFSYVTACDPETGVPYEKGKENTPTTRFLGLIQAPERFDRITAILALKKIAERLDSTHPVKVNGIEIALDARPSTGTTSEELAQLTAHFYWSLSKFVAPTQRLYGKNMGSGMSLIQLIVERGPDAAAEKLSLSASHHLATRAVNPMANRVRAGF
jgi:hypothetical protein